MTAGAVAYLYKESEGTAKEECDVPRFTKKARQNR
jgi:hypothetical protein